MSLLFDVHVFLKTNALSGNILQLSPIDMTVLTTLAFHIGRNEYCWVSQKILATECLISPRQLRRALFKLQSANLVKTYPAGRFNHYTITGQCRTNSPMSSSTELGQCRTNSPMSLTTEDSQSAVVPLTPLLDQRDINTKAINNKPKQKKIGRTKTLPPADFAPTENHHKLANELEFEKSGLSVDVEWIDCREWHLKNHKPRVDWNVTFEKWLIRAKKFNIQSGKGKNYVKPETHAERVYRLSTQGLRQHARENATNLSALSSDLPEQMDK